MKNTAGNALFLILIAVALFAALSYAITSSDRGGGNISREQSRLLAGQIVQFGSLIEAAIQRMKLVNGCRDEMISFDEGGALLGYGSYENPFSPADYSCHVFRPEGGNVTYRTFTGAEGMIQPFFVGVNVMPAIGTTCEEAACVDLIMTFYMKHDRQLCEALNIIHGNHHLLPLVPTALVLVHPGFAGTYEAESGSVFLPSAHKYAGLFGACYRYSVDSAMDIYYQVLLAR